MTLLGFETKKRREGLKANILIQITKGENACAKSYEKITNRQPLAF